MSKLYYGPVAGTAKWVSYYSSLGRWTATCSMAQPGRTGRASGCSR